MRLSCRSLRYVTLLSFVDVPPRPSHIALSNDSSNSCDIPSPPSCPPLLFTIPSSQRFLVEVPNIEDSVRDNVAYHMAYAHQCVTEASVRYMEAFRRYNYTTPKSYLELISLYKSLLDRKRSELKMAKERLENGVDKIAQASAQVFTTEFAWREAPIWR